MKNTHINSSSDLQELLPPGLRYILEHVADIERALSREVDSRISSEYSIHTQVDERVRLALEKQSDRIENEIKRMYRRIEADIADRLDSFSRDVASVSNSMSKLSRQVEVLAIQVQETRAQLARLDKRMGSKSSPHLSSESSIGVSREEVTPYLGEMVQNDFNNGRKLSDLDDYLHNKVMTRIEAIEDWLKANLTPEVVRLKEQIKAESLLREDNDREVMEIVGQYTEIMRRHFDGIRKETDQVPSLPSNSPPSKNPEPNEKLQGVTHKPSDFRKTEGWQQLSNIFTT
jgi:septal ring factor EnvC (AmiA/AmiB activator)